MGLAILVASATLMPLAFLSATAQHGKLDGSGCV